MAIWTDCQSPASITPPQPGGLKASRLQLINDPASAIGSRVRSRRSAGGAGRRLQAQSRRSPAVDVEVEILLREGVVGAVLADCLDRGVDLALELVFALAQADADAEAENIRIVLHI